MATLDLQVGASTDDCARQLAVTPWFSVTSTCCYAGDNGADYYDYRTGMRFTAAAIPQGATISVAYISLKAKGLEGSVPDTIISGEDVDDAATFSTAANFDGRPRTSASGSWTPAAWVFDTWYNSSSIVSIIQEIVNRGGWASGNALVIFWGDALGYIGSQKRLVACSYNEAPTDAPKLHIEYSTGWTGKIAGVTNPAKVLGVAVANIGKVIGVS